MSEPYNESREYLQLYNRLSNADWDELSPQEKRWLKEAQSEREKRFNKEAKERGYTNRSGKSNIERKFDIFGLILFIAVYGATAVTVANKTTPLFTKILLIGNVSALMYVLGKK